METITEKLLEGNSVLFLGSGFSLDATNALGENIPGVSSLISELLKAIGTSEQEISETQDPLPDVADYCLATEDGRIACTTKLRQLFLAETLANWQIDLITAFPWKRIYTTNYDNIVEVACAKQKNRSLFYPH